ncbi:hypothetical protein HW278_04525 [Capnocytophaga sp. oral taxon 902]|uniref:hypothetical protein n=1 Tax=Capnocytophaga sp. oral taxon 902 TaxID=2748316 RepID=UPI0015BA8F40|nr:hypothetical protein [Capnocytophaga sp. oral taxon 902]QLF50016.1 hypothetical protein HW278_04525 [Capnocytophaga sp. oral taxon 902]
MNPIQYFLWGDDPVKPEFHIDLVNNPLKTGVWQFDFDETLLANMTFYMSDESPIFFKSPYSLFDYNHPYIIFGFFEERMRNCQSFKVAHCNKFKFSVIIQKPSSQPPFFNFREVKLEIGKKRLLYDQEFIFFSNNLGSNKYDLEFSLLTSPIIITEFFKRFVVVLPTS